MKDDRRAKYIRCMMAEIKELRRNNYMMKRAYVDVDGETSYERVVPICFKEHESDWYLLVSTENDWELIFAIEIHYRSGRDRNNDGF